jgi:hypothetical protein
MDGEGSEIGLVVDPGAGARAVTATSPGSVRWAAVALMATTDEIGVQNGRLVS